MDLMDLAPTVLDLLGITPDVHFDGMSLLQDSKTEGTTTSNQGDRE
jgi:arylsulfatase A-like enzyme